MQELLQAQILAHPEDDGPRLVYADWLSEQGDPQGAFVHDQVRLARLDECAPDWPVLHARSERALLQRRMVWEEPLRSVCPDGSGRGPEPGLSWRRGLVEGVSLDARHLAPLEPLAALTPLRRVELSSPRPLCAQDLAPVLAIRPPALVLRARTSIASASRYLLRSPVVEILRELRAPWLRELDLAGCKLFPDGARALVRLLEGVALRRLSLQGCEVGDAGLRHLLDAGVLGELRHLGLSDCLRLSTLERLAELPGSEPLSLSLGEARAGAAELYAVGLLLERRPLSALWMEGAGELPELDLLLEAPALRSIGRLGLPGWFRRAGGPGLDKLAALPFERLTRLDLSSARFGPGQLSALLRSPGLQGLVSLGLSGSQLGDEGVQTLVSSPLRRLVSLDLSSCGLSDRGVQLLAGWPGLAHVTRLSLSGNAVHSAGFRALMSSPWFHPTIFECAVPALHAKVGRMRRPRPSELEERFGAALRR